jgi:coenzyme PQQ biosynthesis protein PqqD
VARVDEPVFAAVEDEIVMLSLERGKYFHLNSAASSIWELLETPRTLAELCRELEQRFDVPAAQCEADVREFLAELEARSLLVFHD